MFNGASSMKSQEEESAANKRKRSSFDSDSDDDSSSESGEEETFNSATTTFMDEQEEKPSSVVASSSSSSSVINQNNNTNTIDHDHDGNDEETISEFKKALLLKLSKYSKMITQNELDILEQQLLSNPFSFASEWDELIGQYQYRSYIGQFNLHQVDKRNTDLPTQYSVLLNNQYINVSAREKTRHLRWKRSEFLKLGEESWLNWIREEELHYMEGNFSDNIQRDVIKCIYERALLWENYSYKELRIKYCKFMLKYYKNDENSIDDSFNLLFNLVGYDEDICNLYLKYLKQHSKDSKTRNVYSNLLKHPNQSVFTIWKEYGQWEKEPSDEMKARYIHALKQVEERISFQKPKQDESSYLDMINFELQKYNDCKGLRSTKNFAEMSEEDLNEIGSILKERIVLLLRRVACEINTEKLWNMLFNFLISEKDEFISNDGASSSGTIFKTLKNLHETINRNFKYLDNGFLSVYLQNIEYADSSLASALYLHVTCWVAFKNLSWNSEMHKHLIQSLELLHESNNQHLESSSIYLKLLNDTMFNKCMHALNSFANDLSFNDYYQVFSTVCSSLTRLNRKLYFAVSSRSEPNESLNTSLIEVSQATDQSFQTFSDYLDQYFKTDTYRMHHLELQYAEFILENGQSQRSLDFLENVIVNNETFKKELRAWQDFIQFLEKINWYEINNETPLETKHDKISATYDLGIRSMENPSTKQILARLWLHYEKVNSNSLSNIIKVETLLKQFKDSQKKKKEKATTGKEKSNNKEKSEKKSKDEKTEKKKKEKEDRPKKKVKFSEEVEVQQVPSSTNMDTTETETVTTTSTVVEQDVVMKESENIKPKEEPIQESSTSTEVKPQKEPKKKESSEKCMNVLVWNLPFSMKEQDIRDLFQQHSFQPKRITLITHDNGSSKGMVFVELDSLETIQLAIEKLHNYGIDNEGNLLKVAHADPFKMKKLLKRQKEIANKPKSAPKFVKESDTRQKKPSMFKPRSVPKKSETINSSASASNETTHPSSNVTVSSTNGNQQQQPSSGLSNDDFKKFLR